MAVRILMFDVDGVLISHPNGRSWTSGLHADLGICPRDLDRVFFKAHFDEVLTGKADLLDRLDSVLREISSVSSQELVDYWFAHDATLDKRLISELGQAREFGLSLHLATIQEHHRARFLWNSIGLRDHFEAIHYAAEIGALKTGSRFYRVIESRTGLDPAEHCLIDDRYDNVEAARRAGWRAFLWTSASHVGDVLQSITL